MILIAANSVSKRLEYISQVMFKYILKTDFRVILLEEIKMWVGQYPTCSLIYYSNQNNFGSGAFVIPDEGLLFEEEIEKKNIEISDEPYLKLRFISKSYADFSFDYDLLSSAFYLITEYEKYADPKYDEHERYDENYYGLYKYNHIPVVHEYAEELWDKLFVLNPVLERERRKFDYTLSFDIDAPYLYKGRSAALHIAGMGKEILSLQFRQFFRRLKYYFGGGDPYNVYDWLLSKVDKNKLLFFFLLDRHSQYDGRHTYTSGIYRRLIQKVKEENIAIGIHPSYTSYLNPNRIIFEKEKLEEISGVDIELSRMHFLKYRLPETYRYLELAGIKHDYTACPVHSPGFKNFIAVPFPWFDLKRNKISDLMVHPTMVMDSTLQKYMKSDKEQALIQIREVIEMTKKYEGHFVLLFHNTTLSEQGEWKGWRGIFEEILSAL